MLETMKECLEWLYEPRDLGEKYDLSRMQNAMRIFGNPVDYKCIHIAGTNGKGSTLSYIKNALMRAGYNVGTYISPFVVIFNERITFNNMYITDKEFIDYTNVVRVNMLSENFELTFFEILTMIAFLYFKDKGVDYAIIETGLGGRLDATNVISKEVAVITNIGYDHMEILGDTLEEILMEKLGIVHNNLVTTIQHSLRPLVNSFCDERGVDLTYADEVVGLLVDIDKTEFWYKDFHISLKMLGDHQAVNASLAIETLLYLRNYRGLKISDDEIKTGIEGTFWPGRLERIGPRTYVDGSHNINGVRSLTNFLSHFNCPKTIVFSCLADKNYSEMIAEVDSIADEIFFTTFDYYRAAPAKLLFDASTHPKKKLLSNYKEGFNHLSKRGITVFCGSLYFISLVRQK